MSQMSFFDAEYADKRNRKRRDALLSQSEPVHPSDASQEHRLGAAAVYAFSNLWMARQWFAWAGEVRP